MSTSGVTNGELLSNNTSNSSSTRDETVSPSIVTAPASTSTSGNAEENVTEPIGTVDASLAQDPIANIGQADRPSIQATPSSNHIGLHDLGRRERRRLVEYRRIQHLNIRLYAQIQEEMYRVSVYEAVTEASASHDGA